MSNQKTCGQCASFDFEKSSCGNPKSPRLRVYSGWYACSHFVEAHPVTGMTVHEISELNAGLTNEIENLKAENEKLKTALLAVRASTNPHDVERTIIDKALYGGEQ